MQGQNHRDLNPAPLVFRVNNPQPGRMTMHLNQIARMGAHLQISVDGKLAAERDFPATAADTKTDAALSVDIPAGAHAVSIENTGQDWSVVSDFSFTNAATALVAYGLTDGHWAALWIYHRGQIFKSEAPQSVVGKVSLSGLQPGSYRAVCWDTIAGAPLQTVPLQVNAAERPLLLDTPPITRDVALYVELVK